ncbi:MAG: GAF domain-containing protein [Deltaproteobacteria bacterium]|nr:GAF domain-containing protein [Deltaproteobacteria bacterium]
MTDEPGSRSHWIATIEDLRAQLNAARSSTNWRERTDVFLSVVADAAAMLLGRRDVNELLAAMLDHACLLMGAAHAYYGAKEGDDGIRVLVGKGIMETVVGMRLPYQGVSGAAILSGRAECVHDYETWEGRSQDTGDVVVRSAIAVPLLANGQFVTGVLTLFHCGDEEGRFGDDDERLLAGFAQLASVALDNARLFETLQVELHRKDAAEKGMRESERRFAEVIDFLPEAMLAVDRKGRVIAWNRAMAELTGVGSSAVMGRGEYASSVPFYGVRRPMPIDLALRSTDDAGEEMENVVRDGESIVTEIHFPNLRPGGAYLAIRARPTRDPGGRINGAVQTIRDVTARRRMEIAVRESRERLMSHQSTLMDLTKLVATRFDDLDALFREVSAISAATLGVRRMGIRFFNEERNSLVCRERYDAATGRHTSGEEFAQARHPTYFRHLLEDRLITAHDALADPRTREFAADYFPRYGIASTMDCPIRGGGKLLGVVCHEHVGAPRRWTVEEESFAASVGDLIALALESWTRRKVERELQASIRFEDLIIGITTRFCGAASADVDAAIEIALGEIGEFAVVDRAYLFDFADGGRRFSNTHEWCAPDVTPHIADLQNLASDDFAYLVRRIHAGEVFHVPVVAELPPEAANERLEFEREGIRSILCIPIRTLDDVTGFMGFDSVREPLTWTDHQIRLLKTVASLIAVVRERARAASPG